MSKKEHKSDCCQASIKIISADEGTCHWECEKCGESCNDTFYCKKETIIKSNYDKPEDMEMICEKHNCDIRKCDECFQGNEKESNKGESWRKGYQQGVKEERERIKNKEFNY